MSTASFLSCSSRSDTSRPTKVERRSSTFSLTMPAMSRSMTSRGRRNGGTPATVDGDVLMRPVREELLHVADREGLVDLLAAAGGLARGGAHRSADRGHGVRV